MHKRQSHWPALVYYHPCFDFSKSIQAYADYMINIHEPSSSLVRFILLLVVEFVVVLLFYQYYFPFFIETLNDKQYLKHYHQS